MAGLKQSAAIVFVALCAAYYVKVNIVEELPGLADSPSDFTHQYRAARRVAAGQSPYADANYDYPPAIAFLLTPLARTDYVTARRIWFWCSHAFLLTAAFLTWRGLGGGLASACNVGGVWALGGAAAENFGLGQLGPLLVLLLTVVYWRRASTQGAALGAGLSLKFIPGVAAIVLLLRRDWRAIEVAAAVAFAGIVLPSAAVSRWYAGPAAPVHGDYLMGTPALLNWSFPAMALRVADPPSGSQLPVDWEFGNVPENLRLPVGRRRLSAGIAVGVLLAGVAMLCIACRWKLDAAQVPWAAAALISLGVAASPISWTHYQILQYPGLAMLLCHAAKKRRWRLGLGAVVLGAVLYQIPVAVLRAYYQAHQGWTAASPATLYIWTSVTPVAALVLFGVLLRTMRWSGAP